MMNPFDATNVNNIVEVNHVLQWYALLSEAMRQRCVDTIVDDQRMLAFLRQATAHLQHDPDAFDADVIIDLTRRMLAKLRR